MFLWWSKQRLWLVDLKYNFKCDWLIKLSKKLSDNKQCDNKLSDDNLASAVEVNKGFFSTNHSQGDCNFYH